MDVEASTGRIIGTTIRQNNSMVNNRMMSKENKIALLF
jgi:hypothetical protein